MSYFAQVRIWESVQRAIRASMYEAPLASALLSHRLGELAGSSVVMSSELEIEYFEIELILVDLDKALDLVKLVLEEAGAPAGSEIRIEREEGLEILPFGRKEGLAIYLDGIGLPDEVYEKCSCDGLAFLIAGALSSVDGEIRGSWVGRSETAVYLYGPNAETMFSTIKPMLTTYPLCQNARIVIRHGNPQFHPRTERLPFHGDADKVRQVFWANAQGTG
jgi:hypothetical protein